MAKQHVWVYDERAGKYEGPWPASMLSKISDIAKEMSKRGTMVIYSGYAKPQYRIRRWPGPWGNLGEMPRGIGKSAVAVLGGVAAGIAYSGLSNRTKSAIASTFVGLAAYHAIKGADQ